MNLSIRTWAPLDDPADQTRWVHAIEFQTDANAAVVEEFTGGTLVVDTPDPDDPSATVEHVDYEGGSVPLGWIVHRPVGGGDLTEVARAEFLQGYSPHHVH